MKVKADPKDPTEMIHLGSICSSGWAEALEGLNLVVTDVAISWSRKSSSEPNNFRSSSHNFMNSNGLSQDFTYPDDRSA